MRLATRGSPLALLQARRVASLISAATGAPAPELVVVRTTGDRLAEAPIEKIGGQGAFVKEVSAAVAERRADVAVHSAKDLPSGAQPGLTLAAVPERADPRDAMVGCALDDLLPGSVVATGSVRRRAQLAWLRPDLTFSELRGNIERRVEVAEKVGAGVLAMAALVRLGLTGHVAEALDCDRVLPQVGQGAIALECRESDSGIVEMMAAIDDVAAHNAVLAERAFLASLGSGCSLPCGAYATAEEDSELLVLDAMMASRDGHVLLRRSDSGTDPVELGRNLARTLLDEAGGRSLADWDAEDAFIGVPPS